MSVVESFGNDWSDGWTWYERCGRSARRGVRTILERASEFRVVGEIGSGTEAVEFCKETHPDLVLMAIALPGMNGIEATTEILLTEPCEALCFARRPSSIIIVNAVAAGNKQS